MFARDDWGYNRSKPRRRSLSPPRATHLYDESDDELSDALTLEDIRPRRSKPRAAFEAGNLRISSLSHPRAAFEASWGGGQHRHHGRRASFEDRLPTRPRVYVAPHAPYARDAGGYLSPPDETGHFAIPAGWQSPRIHYREAIRPPSPQILPPDVVERRHDYPMPSVAITNLPVEARRSALRARLDGGKQPGRAISRFSPSYSRPRPVSSTSSSGIPRDKIFRYKELGWMEFRLVRILPEKMSTIKCEIVHASLESLPRYTAISYAWGDAGDMQEIQVDRCSVPITSSLYGALKALRRKFEDVLVWADALCIDQQNKDERTQQVQFMTSIYTKANSVAVWLGPEADDSAIALDLLGTVADQSNYPELIRNLISSPHRRHSFAALISLFERDYWRRLWVVQEIFNARDITVYCGSSRHPWAYYMDACDAFRRHVGDLDHYFPGGLSDGQRYTISLNQLTYSQVLVHQGPRSFPDLRSLTGLGDGSLLEVLRACRRKLAAEPRDKVFGILGVLPEDVHAQFPPDYNLSVKDVYTNVVDYLLTTTERLDVICESIYFPLHTSSANLPSWVPDWSHIPQTSALGLSYDFSAADTTTAQFDFKDSRRTKLEFSAIYIDTIRRRGIAVGTLCGLDDFLIAFLHWRAMLLENHDTSPKRDYNLLVHEAFCRTLCMDQLSSSKRKRPREWMTVCYHVFASLVRERLPHLPLDEDLQLHIAPMTDVPPTSRRRILQDNCGSRMMGRCFCLTDEGLMGMGSGFMASGDVVVVPLGCYTPVILRPEGGRGEYRFVGDVYVDGYMRGRAVDQWRSRRRELQKYVLH